MKEARILRGGNWGERLKNALAESSLAELDWMEQHTQLLKSDAHSRVGLITLQDRLCYLKFYSAKSMGQKILFRLGYSRGLRSFDAATELLAVDVQVPAPLACLLLSRGMMLLTQGVAGGRDLKALWQGDTEPAKRELLMSSAGHTLAVLHKAGYCHGDCKWSNFLWSTDGFYLVDLEGVKKTAAGGKTQARDLARFTVNAEDMGVEPECFELFLERYLQGGNHSRETIIRAIMPFLRQLRQRHKLKYGERGQQILREP